VKVGSGKWLVVGSKGIKPFEPTICLIIILVIGKIRKSFILKITKIA
jgi:hypothetical protein